MDLDEHFSNKHNLSKVINKQAAIEVRGNFHFTLNVQINQPKDIKNGTFVKRYNKKNAKENYYGKEIMERKTFQTNQKLCNSFVLV